MSEISSHPFPAFEHLPYETQTEWLALRGHRQRLQNAFEKNLRRGAITALATLGVPFAILAIYRAGHPDYALIVLALYIGLASIASDALRSAEGFRRSIYLVECEMAVIECAARPARRSWSDDLRFIARRWDNEIRYLLRSR